MGLSGTKVRDPNFRLRLLLIFFCGIGLFGVLLYWRSQVFLSTEYADLVPTPHALRQHALDIRNNQNN